MNKKVDEEFKNINDVYVLQCICTELKELCDKYEEEHNTTFKEWQKNIQANKKAIEYIRIQQTIFKDYDTVIENQLKNISNILEGKNEYNK